MPGLSSVQRRQLKARAHSLKPVVLIGASGLTPAVVAEIDRTLKSHELIKLRVAGTDRDAREALLAEICLRAGAQPVQHIGKILVVFRENPEAPRPSIEPTRGESPRARRPTTKVVAGPRPKRRARATSATRSGRR